MLILLMAACTLLLNNPLASGLDEKLPFDFGFGDPTTGCSIGWTHAPSDQTCVKVFKLSSADDGEAFFKARKICQRQGQGADFAQITDEAKAKIFAEMSLRRFSGDVRAWIGVWKGCGIDTPFITVDGDDVPYTMWPTSPFTPRESKSCVQYTFNTSIAEQNPNGDWEEMNCDVMADFVCQRPVMTLPKTEPFDNSQVDDETGCLTGWTLYKIQNKCLKVFDDGYGLSYWDASSICGGKHGYLARVEDEEKQHFVTDLMTQTESLGEAWVATSNKGIEEMVREGGRCNVVHAMEDEEVGEKVVDCQEYRPFVCERPSNGWQATAPCREGWTFFEKFFSCIKVHDGRKRSWYTARFYCQNAGGDLFMPKGHRDEKTILVMDLQKDNTFYWIGIYSPKKDGHFQFINGESIDAAIPWRLGEPNDFGQEEDCAEMKNGQLYDKDCMQNRDFVCEISLDGG